MALLNSRKTRRFRVHSIAVEILGPGADLLARDFDFFTDRPEPLLTGEDAAYSVTLEIIPQEPKAEDIPDSQAEHSFPGGVVYREQEALVYEYFGANLKVMRHGQSSYGILKCNDSSLVEELGYLFLQKEITYFLAMLGLHKLQALGMGLPSGKSALILLPKGEGKSLLAAEFLQKEGFALLSDESPLVDRLGNLHPYPMRLSFRVGTKLPEKWMAASAILERQQQGSRLLVPVRSLAPASLPRPTDTFRPGYIFIGKQIGAKSEPNITPLGRWKSSWPLLRDFFINENPLPTPWKKQGLKLLPDLAPRAASQLAAATALLARAKSFQLELTRDSSKNAAFLAEKIHSFEKSQKNLTRN